MNNKTCPVSIRRATAADIPRLADLWAEYIDFHASLDPYWTRPAGAREKVARHMEETLTAPHFIYLAGEVDGSVQAYTAAEIFEDCMFGPRRFARIHDLMVTKDYRCRGIGTVMIDHLTRELSHEGISRIELQQITCNTAAEQFWTKLGFKTFQCRRERTLEP